MPPLDLSLLWLLFLARFGLASNSTKRGLVFVPDPNHPEDNSLWPPPGTDLTWYYNYGASPSPAYIDIAQSEFEFVPMLWGVDSTNPNATTFLDTINELIEGGTKISHVLGFNEPDAPYEYGGSQVQPRDGAAAWVHNFQPLAEKGIKLGLPACTGAPSGIPWLKQFLANCSEILSEGHGETKNCTWDFVPVHWYDNFGGLASHIGEVKATWPNAKIWATEYAYAHQDLQTSQEFFNQTVDYFDNKLDYLDRYSYFGAFRSDKANVGPNAAFLDRHGKLTDIGSWYLGGSATGVEPDSAAAAQGTLSVWALLTTAALTTLWLRIR